LFQILRKRREVSEHISRFASLARKSHSFDATQYKEFESLLEEILPGNFLTEKSVNDLVGCIRFFQALMIRIERAHANPTKDQMKVKQLEPYLDRIKKIPADCSTLPLECRQEIALYKTMISNFRVTIFAPELKGGTKVSAKKLKLQWQVIQSLCPGI